MSTDPNQPVDASAPTVDAFGNPIVPIVPAPVDPTLNVDPAPVASDLPVDPAPAPDAAPAPVDPAPVADAPVADVPTEAPVDASVPPIVDGPTATPVDPAPAPVDAPADPAPVAAPDVTTTALTISGERAVDTTKHADGSETVVDRASTIEEQLNQVADEILDLVVGLLPGVSGGSIETSATGFSVTLTKPGSVDASHSPEVARGPLDATPAESIRHDNLA